MCSHHLISPSPCRMYSIHVPHHFHPSLQKYIYTRKSRTCIATHARDIIFRVYINFAHHIATKCMYMACHSDRSLLFYFLPFSYFGRVRRAFPSPANHFSYIEHNERVIVIQKCECVWSRIEWLNCKYTQLCIERV